MAKTRLKKREKVLLAVGAAVIGLLALTPIVRNLQAEYDRSVRQLEQARASLREAKEWRATIEAERSGQNAILDQIQRRGPTFELYTFTNRLIRELKLDDRAKLQSKRQAAGGNLDGVEIVLTSVTLPEFVDLLHRIYASDNLIILQRLDHLRAARNGAGLDCQLTLIAPKQA